MAKRRVISKKKIIRFIFFCIIFLIVVGLMGAIFAYQNSLKPVDSKGKAITFEVKENSTLLTLAQPLKESNLIRSEFFYKLYIKLHHKNKIKVGTYSLSPAMTVDEIINILGDNNSNIESLVTFKEGINMRGIVSLITKYTKNSANDVYTTLKDEVFLNKIIQKYWFLTDEIKNKKIYYSLEGYLFPDSYNIQPNDTVEDIFIKMLNNTEKKLNNIKTLIQSKSYTVHNLLTFASIVEAESPNKVDRKQVAGVFFNRIAKKISLGSDVTTYYSVKIDVAERDLYQSEINACNAYNTRCTSMKGIPVGPINNPGIESIMATLQPSSHQYLYFVADKNKKTYYAKTYQEHLNIVKTLKEKGLWFTY